MNNSENVTTQVIKKMTMKFDPSFSHFQEMMPV